MAYRIPCLSMAESDAQRRFSEYLNLVMKMDFVSQSTSKILRSLTYIREIILKHQHSQIIVSTGSVYEGSMTKGSDVDFMFVMPGIIAVKDRTEIKVHSGYVFRLDTANVRPGYTKLVLMKKYHTNDIPDEMKVATFLAVEASLLTAKNSECYFSSKKYTDFYLHITKHTYNFSSYGMTLPSYYVHGPCMATSYSNTSLGIPATESDMALGIQCAEWPLEAEEWLERKREKGWPSAKMIEAIRMMPCYILPVGDPTSKTQHIEWRFAFVPAERELVWSFNDCQIQCYNILKVLKKEYLNAVASDELSSFYLKTIVFWISEEEGLEMWTPSNLLECIRLCLIRLQESIDSTFLSHYILRKRNLLFAKFEDQKVKQNTVGKISEIIERLIPFILECHNESNISMEYCFQLWLQCRKDLITFLDKSQELVMDDPMIFSEIEQTGIHKACSGAHQSVVHISTSLQTLLNIMESIDKLPSDIHSHLRESTRSFLKVRVGMTLLADLCLSTKESMRPEMISSAAVCFKDGINMDGMCGHLYMSTFHFISCSREKAEIIMRDIFSRNMVLFYCGKCGKGSYIEMARGNQVDVINNYIKITKSTISFDMVFTSTDVLCVPHGLQYECALLGKINLNYCLIHPVVYAQYLHFEIAHSSKNPTECEEALGYLSDAVKNVEGYLEEHRALNLLGLCYSKSGRRSKAIECFVRSLGKTPTVWNAACYHLCVIVYRFLDECGKI